MVVDRIASVDEHVVDSPSRAAALRKEHRFTLAATLLCTSTFIPQVAPGAVLALAFF